MKKLIIAVLILSGILFAQDSTKVSINEYQSLVKQIDALKGLIVNQHLRAVNKGEREALFDLYIHAINLEKQYKGLSDLTENFINEISKVKTIEDLDIVLKKYEIEREK